MTKEDILNLSEDERIKILENTDIKLSENETMNSNHEFDIILTLSEEKRKKIVEENKLNLSSNELKKVVFTLKEKLRKEIIKENVAKNLDRQAIILSLKETSRKEILKQEGIELDTNTKIAIILSLSEENIKEILNESLLSEIEKTKLIEKLSEKNKIKLIEDKTLNSSDKKEIILGFSEKTRIQILKEDKIELDKTDKEEIINSLSEEEKVNAIIDGIYDSNLIYGIMVGLSIETKINLLRHKKIGEETKKSILYDLTEEVAQEVLIQNFIELEDKQKNEIILKMCGDTRRQILKDNKIKLSDFCKKEIIISLKDKHKKEFLEKKIVKLNPYERLEIMLSLKKQNRGDFLNKLDEQEEQIFKFIKPIIDTNINPKEVIENMKEKEDCLINGVSSDITIGIELESEGKSASLIKYIETILNEWKTKIDISLENGVEVVSPVLNNKIQDMKALELVCKLMKQAELETSERCGGHIHIGAKYFKGDYKSWENFLTTWNECEELFYKMSNKKGEKPRQGTEKNAKMSHNDLEKLSENGEIKIENEEEFERIYKQLKKTRYRGLNLSNVGKKEKNTIEFRTPNGTIDSETIKENIKLFASLMQVSKEMALNPEYKKEEFAKIKIRSLTEREKVEALLDLLFQDEKTKSIYRDRWNSVKDAEIFDQLTKKQETETFQRGNYEIASKENFEKVANQEEVIQEMMSNEILNLESVIEGQDREDKNEGNKDKVG